MNNIWTSHLKSEQEKQEFELLLSRAKPVLDRLRDLVSHKDEELIQSENSLKTYENPNWAYRQAHLNGFRSCQARLLKILTPT